MSSAQDRSSPDDAGAQREDLLAARRHRHTDGVVGPGNHELAQMRERRDSVVRPVLRVLAPDERPGMRAQPIVVRPFDRSNEGGGDPVLARAHEDRPGLDRNTLGPAVWKSQQRDAFAVDRDVDILEAGAVAEKGLDRENVLTVRREVVGDHEPTARSVGRALDVIPRVLRDLDGIRVLDARRIAPPDCRRRAGSPHSRPSCRLRGASPKVPAPRTCCRSCRDRCREEATGSHRCRAREGLGPPVRTRRG